MSKTTKVLRTLVVVGVVGGLAALGVFAAFSSQTDNPGNNVTAGTVTLADNDGGTALYDIPAAKPGDSEQSCIRVNYTGSLDADVKLFTPSAIGDLGPHVNLKIEAGTQAAPVFPTCALFNAQTTLYDDPLSDLPTTYAGGVSDYPGIVGTEWTNGDAVVYRVTATLDANAPDTAQGDTTGDHVLRWEARNQ